MESYPSPTAYYLSRGLTLPDRKCNRRVVGEFDYWSAGPMCQWHDSRSHDVLHIAFMPLPAGTERPVIRSLPHVSAQPVVYPPPAQSWGQLCAETRGELVATQIVRNFVRSVRVISGAAAFDDFELLLHGYGNESDYQWVLERVCCITSVSMRPAIG